MKITMVHGQNHKGSTYNISKLLIDQITCDKEVKEFFLPKDFPHFCTGCYSCIEDETKCPYYGEKSRILHEIETSDLIVFTTPTYCMAPSAPLKSFMDMTFTYWLIHRPRACMFHKKAVVISTAAGIGTKKAIQPIATALFYWGVPWIRKYGISVQAMNWNGVADKKKAKIQKDMGAIARTISRGKKPRVGIKTKFMFFAMRKMQKMNMGSGPTEKKFWEEKGWLEKERPWKQVQKTTIS